MVRPTNKGMTAIEKIIIILTSPRRRKLTTRRGPHGEAPGPIGRHEKQEEKVDKSLYFGFYKKKQVREGKQTWDWLI